MENQSMELSEGVLPPGEDAKVKTEPVRHEEEPKPGNEPKKKPKIPLILGIAGGIVALVFAIASVVKRNTTDIDETPIPIADSYTYTPGEAVDLGLSVKWSSVNLGASKPEDYGAYFAWGETIMKSDFTWENYTFRTSGDSYDNVKFSKYNTKDTCGPVDNITTLHRGEMAGETVDDVARAKWGGNWRMPTNAEFEELLEKCNKEMTTYNGEKGYKFTSKKNPSNWIFLPAAGYRDGTVLYDAGTIGIYWSSSLYTDDPDYAWGLYFFSDYVGTDRYDRYYGLSVRPVSE